MRKMKDSGVEWIGEIPKENNIINNKYFLEYTKGKIPNQLNENGEGIPYIGASDLENKSYTTFTTDKNLPNCDIFDTLVLWDGARAGLIGTRHKGIISSTVIKLKADDKIINKKFLYWYMKGFQWYFLQNVNGTTIPHMNRKFIDDIKFIDFNYEVQDRIAVFLDKKCFEMDSLSKDIESEIELLEEYKKSVITEAVTKGLNPNVEMKDSGVEWIGKIPKDWYLPKIKYLAKISSGSTPDRTNLDYWNGAINWIKTGELKNKEIYDSEEKVTLSAVKNCSLNLFDVNTILIAMYGQGKTRGMTALLKVPSTTNQACSGIAIKNDKILVEYLWYFLMGAYDYIRELANGSGQPNLSSSMIENFRVALPSRNEQQEIVKFIRFKINNIDRLLSNKQCELVKIEEYKKSLIYECVTGKKGDLE